LHYLGQLNRAYQSQDIAANRFTLIVRGLTPGDCERIDANTQSLAAAGVPNYFDDQRFGSVGRDRRFIALEMIHGRFEAALKLALASDYEHDRAADKAEKAILNECWGHWAECKAKLPRGHARSLVDFLCQRPGDYKGAVGRLRPELSGLYLSAYQSHVWNRILAKWIESRTTSTVKLDLKLGGHPAPVTVMDNFGSLLLPLPSARMKNEVSLEERKLIDEVLSDDNITLETMRVPGLQKPYFSKGHRECCLKLAELHCAFADDDLNRNKRLARLSFVLPRGAYATMVIKRLTCD
jgi:tRNA pseudouridine13 synthase